MQIFKSKIFIGGCLGFITIILGSLTVQAQDISYLKGLFSPRQFTIAAATPLPTATPVPTPVWTMVEKISQAKALLNNIILTVGDTAITYKEPRYASVNGRMITTAKIFKEPEKQIALAVLDTSTGQIQTITIIKRGPDLIAPSGWNIEILQRPNGIRWNGWNTAYRIDQASPTSLVVIANVYPDEKDTTVAKKKNGKTTYVTNRTIEHRFYSPYSPDLHSSGLVEIGQHYTADMVTRAFTELRIAGVRSRAMPGTLVADVFASRSQFFTRIPLLEQTDLTEFEFDPINTIERVQVIIGANGAGAFNATCNSSSACGWVQFTPGTYAVIVKSYPAAQLIKDFKAGAADHLNSMKAAILLYDENLKGLIKAHGQKMIEDPRLEEYLASSYNGAPRHVYATLTASILGGIQDWISALTSKKGGLKDETKGYLVKLRWLQQNNTSVLSARL